jgi:hypothetical protein
MRGEIVLVFNNLKNRPLSDTPASPLVASKAKRGISLAIPAETLAYW